MYQAAPIAGRRILVAEDEYVIAEDIRLELEERGAQVVGPVPTATIALREIAADNAIDCAVLDIKLQGGLAFDVADALIDRHLPFIFATAYGGGVIPGRYRHIVRCEKPLPVWRVIDALGTALRHPRLAWS